MKEFRWDEEKNALLKVQREVGFEEVVVAILEGCVLDVVEHPNKKKYPNQKIFIVKINQYVYLVPFVETEVEIFLKTIIPSRKATKQYLMSNHKKK